MAASTIGLMFDVTLDRKQHWEAVYQTKGETNVSWYQDDPRLSLELIGAVAPTEGGRIIDVGGGASVLVDRLLESPSREIAVLDISETALGKARSRLGERADGSSGSLPISPKSTPSGPSMSGMTGPSSTS